MLFNEIEGEIIKSIFEMRKRDFLGLIDVNEGFTEKYTAVSMIFCFTQKYIFWLSMTKKTYL